MCTSRLRIACSSNPIVLLKPQLFTALTLQRATSCLYWDGLLWLEHVLPSSFHPVPGQHPTASLYFSLLRATAAFAHAALYTHVIYR